MIATGFTVLLLLLVALLARLIASAPLLATLATCFRNSADQWRESNPPRP